jgi:ribosomal protein L22
MKTPPSDEQKDLTDQLGNLKIHSSVSEDGEKSSSSSGGQEVFYAVKKNAKGSTKRFQAFMKILRGGLTVEEALIQCKLSPKKKVANELYQIINSAKFNAIVGLGREPEDGYVDANCVISKATATKGQYLKRIYVKAKGMAGTMHRARTHIRIEVQEQDARKRMRVFDPNDEERAKIGQEGKTPFEPPWITRRKQGEKRYRFAKEAGIL